MYKSKDTLKSKNTTLRLHSREGTCEVLRIPLVKNTHRFHTILLPRTKAEYLQMEMPSHREVDSYFVRKKKYSLD